MTVHAIRLYVGPDTSKMTFTQARDAWQTWLTNASEWDADRTTHDLEEVQRTLRDGTVVTYWEGTGRFYLADSKDNLLQKCEDKWVNKVSWYRILYHQCVHDETGTGTCVWDATETRQNGTVPSHVEEAP